MLLGSISRTDAMVERTLAIACAELASKVGTESDRYLPYAMAANYYAQLRGAPPYETRLPAGGFTQEQWQEALQEARRIVARRGWEPMVDH